MSTTSYSPRRTLTRVDKRDEQDEIDQRPLDMALITRLFRYTRPHATQRNWLFFLVFIRAIQLPALTWLIALTIRGPIAASDVHGTIVYMAVFFAVAVSTQVVM